MHLVRHSGCYKLALSSTLKRRIAHRFYGSAGFTQLGVSFAIDVSRHARDAGNTGFLKPANAG